MNYIGIDLGGTNIKGALVSAEGEILKEHSIPTRVDLGPARAERDDDGALRAFAAAEEGEVLLAPLRERVRARSFGARYAAAHTRIELCTLGYRAGVIGAAMLALV